jgi:hypothetical protein
VQRVGVQVITGAFRIAITAILEIEASIPTIRQYYTQAGTKLYINLHTLPKTHPLIGLKILSSQRYISPIKKLALAYS